MLSHRHQESCGEKCNCAVRWTLRHARSRRVSRARTYRQTSTRAQVSCALAGLETVERHVDEQHEACAMKKRTPRDDFQSDFGQRPGTEVCTTAHMPTDTEVHTPTQKPPTPGNFPPASCSNRIQLLSQSGSQSHWFVPFLSVTLPHGFETASNKCQEACARPIGTDPCLRPHVSFPHPLIHTVTHTQTDIRTATGTEKETETELDL